VAHRRRAVPSRGYPGVVRLEPFVRLNPARCGLVDQLKRAEGRQYVSGASALVRAGVPAWCYEEAYADERHIRAEHERCLEAPHRTPTAVPGDPVHLIVEDLVAVDMVHPQASFKVTQHRMGTVVVSVNVRTGAQGRCTVTSRRRTCEETADGTRVGETRHASVIPGPVWLAASPQFAIESTPHPWGIGLLPPSQGVQLWGTASRSRGRETGPHLHPGPPCDQVFLRSRLPRGTFLRFAT
jgi:hypothetical protein